MPRQTAVLSSVERAPGEDDGTPAQSLLQFTTVSVALTEIRPVGSPRFSAGEMSGSNCT